MIPSPRKLGLGLVLVVAAYYGAFACWPALFFALGINHYSVWFIDTFALLASNDAVTRGLNPYVPNPLDYFGRPHVYSHWWLHLRDLGLTRADAWWLGLALVGTFAVVALARLRPRSVGELGWYAAVACSSPIMLAVDRANNDLVIFVLLAGLVPCLGAARREVRWLAPLLVAVATLLKYYPAAAALVLLAAGERREVRARVALGALLLALAGLSVAADLRDFGPLAPRPEGLLSFGSTALAHALGWDGAVPKVLALGVAVGATAWCWRRRPLGDWEPGEAARADWLHFILGAALLTGCFFASLNFGYRWIFALWLAPWLWRLPGDPAAPALARQLARITRGLLLFVLWWDPFACFIINRLVGALPAPTITKLADIAFLVEQPFDWALFLGLLVFLAHFTRTSVRRLA